MSDSTQIWVHGVAFEANYPADFIELPELSGMHFVERTDTGIEFRSAVPSTKIFHVSIPSLAVLNEFRMQIFRVYLLYATVGATIKSVRINDGPTLVHVFENLSWSGNHGSAVDDSNRLTLQASREIFHGIGLFVEVDFSGPPTLTGHSVKFFSAGVQLLTGKRLIGTVVLPE
jgi:hypothetical protein